MDNQILKSYPLEFSQPEKIADIIVEKVICPAARDYGVSYTVEIDVIVNSVQFKKISITCPMTNFAKAYWYMGILWEREIMPLIK